MASAASQASAWLQSKDWLIRWGQARMHTLSVLDNREATVRRWARKNQEIC